MKHTLEAQVEMQRALISQTEEVCKKMEASLNQAIQQSKDMENSFNKLVQMQNSILEKAEWNLKETRRSRTEMQDKADYFRDDKLSILGHSDEEKLLGEGTFGKLYKIRIF